ncbi:MAG: RsmD family RNA methyltransferase [Pirellulales bacterium]
MPKPRPAPADEASSAPRIIGGTMRGRRLEFTPDPRTRPMKDRVRETLFDLVGTRVKGAIALDLFAGSGAIGFEALSRGASRAVFVERHFPTAAALRRSAKALEVTDRADVRSGDVLLWAKKLPTAPAPLPVDAPWLVFISPPWEFFQSRPADVLALLAALERAAPAGSTFVVEADTAFDTGLLPDAEAWDIRPIPPAVLCLK